jgi:sugar lactone lactonase YvrE
MKKQELDKETYRRIIDDYFRAFGTGDFSNVKFSSQVEFLSPISGITMKGVEEVGRFVTGVSTRVVEVNVIAINVDFPTAAGVWQMRTSKGVLYTLHNFFRLDGEGLVYIWPMFDPKAVMDDPPGLLQWLTGIGYYDVAVRAPKQLAGVTISKKGRIFVNFPRWIDEPTPSVAEVAADGSLIPYPNETINVWDKTAGDSARERLVCVQSVEVDQDDALWILDPASPNFEGVVPGGPKLIKVNLETNEVVRTYAVDEQGAPRMAYLNDVRFADGHAFISDSGLGAIVVIDLATGKVRRLLDDHPSTKAEPDCVPVIGGRPFRFDNGTTPQVHIDGIAIDPTRKWVYYKPLIGRTLYRVPISALLDESLSAKVVGNRVEQVAVTEPTDGLEFDAKGNLYMTSLEWGAIRILRPDGRIDIFSRANDLLWPDSIAISCNGDLLVSASQFHLMPAFNGGEDKRTAPFKVFRINLETRR